MVRSTTFLEITMNSEPDNKMAYNNSKMILASDILIVDDEAPNLQLLTQLLSDAGYQIHPAEVCHNWPLSWP